MTAFRSDLPAPLARYKDLCIDAVDAQRLGRFWGDVLGLQLHVQDNGDAYLTGDEPTQTIWINQVPEPKTVKHRVHLDVNAESVAQIERLGATVLDAASFRWTVMADPEGGEFCVFVRNGDISRRLYEIGVDTTGDPAAAHAIATWWAQLLGGRVDSDEEQGFSWVEEIPGAPFDGVVFVPVPEPKQVKNRIHLDVVTHDMDALLSAGAVLLRARDDEIRWNVMADPDGNEFCAFEQPSQEGPRAG